MALCAKKKTKFCPFSAFASIAKCYCLRLKSNRYSSNRITAPMIDMIQPAGCPALYQPRAWAEVSGNERASDAEQNRHDKSSGIFPRHQ